MFVFVRSAASVEGTSKEAPNKTTTVAVNRLKLPREKRVGTGFCDTGYGIVFFDFIFVFGIWW